jgi:hypothetical protein
MAIDYKIFGLALAGTLLGYLGFALADPAITDINKVQPDNRGSNIYLKGKVTAHAPLLGSGAYQLEDKTGKVWVLTNEKLPQTGTEIAIEGQVEYQDISIEQQNLGELYIVQVKQLDRAPDTEPSVTPTPTPQDELFLPHR